MQLVFKSIKSATHKNFELICEAKQIKQSHAEFRDWDDSMCNVRHVTQTEYNWIMKRREEEEARRREEEAAIA